MKTPSSHLFDLIKSLDKSEKRYFRIFTSKEVNNDSTLFIKLYDLIEKQAEGSDIYNEDDIKKQLAGSKLLKQFPFYKNYLYNILLQSLRHYHSSTSTDAFLKNKTQEINILYDKGLFAQCDSLIKDTKKSRRNTTGS